MPQKYLFMTLIMKNSFILLQDAAIICAEL